MVDVLVLPAEVRRAIVQHARRESPRECCGFIIGGQGIVDQAVAATNVEPGTTRYQIDPGEHIALRRALRATDRNILGVYHSHPAGSAQPSATDVAEAHYPDWAYVIVGLRGSRASIRAFYLAAPQVIEIPVRRQHPARG